MLILIKVLFMSSFCTFIFNRTIEFMHNSIAVMFVRIVCWLWCGYELLTVDLFINHDGWTRSLINLIDGTKRLMHYYLNPVLIVYCLGNCGSCPPFRLNLSIAMFIWLLNWFCSYGLIYTLFTSVLRLTPK